MYFAVCSMRASRNIPAKLGVAGGTLAAGDDMVISHAAMHAMACLDLNLCSSSIVMLLLTAGDRNLLFNRLMFLMWLILLDCQCRFQLVFLSSLL
jgi:hypothetical protein